MPELWVTPEAPFRPPRPGSEVLIALIDTDVILHVIVDTHQNDLAVLIPY